MNVTNVTKNRQKKAFLESLEKGVSIKEACDYAGVSRMTIWRWRKIYLGFNNKVLLIIDSRTQTVEDALYMNAVNGNITAQIFWLKNRAKERWSDRFEHSEELKGEITITDARQKILSRINSIASRKRKNRNNQQSK